jgi:hypothetical protein
MGERVWRKEMKTLVAKPEKKDGVFVAFWFAGEGDYDND